MLGSVGETRFAGSSTGKLLLGAKVLQLMHEIKASNSSRLHGRSVWKMTPSIHTMISMVQLGEDRYLGDILLAEECRPSPFDIPIEVVEGDFRGDCRIALVDLDSGSVKADWHVFVLTQREKPKQAEFEGLFVDYVIFKSLKSAVIPP